jgi:mannose-6-phosphate isomerase-like protein (cupin superfamily)
MSAYTKINFMDIEAQGGAEHNLRFSRKHIDSRDLGVTLRHFAPNHRSDNAHAHKVQEEVYVVVAGSGRMLLDGKVEELKQWDVVRVAPETVRSLEAGPEGLDLVIAGGPKPEGGDGVQAAADWPK